MPARRRSRVPKTTTPTLTVHQIVAFNFTRARQQAQWTQTETGERLEPFLGYRLNQAGVSAIEKTYDTDRRRNIDAAELVAFARCFNKPIGWFFLPPTGHPGDLVDPVHPDTPFEAAYLTTLVLGTPAGWQSFLDRLTELLDIDHRATWDAVLAATHGVKDAAQWEQQIDLRRRAIEQVTLTRLAGPEDDVITNMARLLVQLAKLTPLGFNKLRDTDPDQALALLAEGDELVETLTKGAERRRKTGKPSGGGFDDLRPIEPEEALRRRESDSS
jgi:hypothetical protein